jgi:hypothetical protein
MSDDNKIEINAKMKNLADLCENIDDDISTDIYANICDISDLHDELCKKAIAKKDIENNKIIDNLEIQIATYKKTITEQNNEIEETMKQNKLFRENLKNLFTIRQYMNLLFNKLWDAYKSKIEQLVTKDMLEKIKINETKKNKDGIKFTAYILYCQNKIPQLKNFSTDLCTYYIEINNQLHPKIKPLNILVLNALKNIKMNINSIIYIQTKTTIDIVDTLEKSLKEYSKLF